MAAELPSPAKGTLEHQLNSVRFLAGVDAGRWEILLFVWPHLYVRVTGRDPQSGHVFSHDFHLECDGLPDPGPLVERWSFADNATHGQLPPAPQDGSPGYLDAMKQWGQGVYRAWSRGAAG